MKSKVTVTLEKSDSDLVPFSITKVVWHGRVPDNDEDLYLIETEADAIPELNFKLETGDKLKFTADFCADYSEDYYGEHDVCIYFENVQKVKVTRVVYEQK